MCLELGSTTLIGMQSLASNTRCEKIRWLLVAAGDSSHIVQGGLGLGHCSDLLLEASACLDSNKAAVYRSCVQQQAALTSKGVTQVCKALCCAACMVMYCDSAQQPDCAVLRRGWGRGHVLSGWRLQSQVCGLMLHIPLTCRCGCKVLLGCIMTTDAYTV